MLPSTPACLSISKPLVFETSQFHPLVSISKPRFNFTPASISTKQTQKFEEPPIDLLLKLLLLAKTIDKRMISAIEGGSKEIARRSIDLAVVYGLWRLVYRCIFRSSWFTLQIWTIFACDSHSIFESGLILVFQYALFTQNTKFWTKKKGIDMFVARPPTMPKGRIPSKQSFQSGCICRFVCRWRVSHPEHRLFGDFELESTHSRVQRQGIAPYLRTRSLERARVSWGTELQASILRGWYRWSKAKIASTSFPQRSGAHWSCSPEALTSPIGSLR